VNWPNFLLAVGSVEFLCLDANFLLFQRNLGTCLLLHLTKTHILITGLLDLNQMFREDCKYTFLRSIHRNVVEPLFFATLRWMEQRNTYTLSICQLTFLAIPAKTFISAITTSNQGRTAADITAANYL